MTTQNFTIPICRHLKTNGIRCQSPALNGETFCYFHLRLHKDHPAPMTAQQIIDTWHEGSKDAMLGAGEDPYAIARAYPHQNEFNFPPLEDADSIQLAASMLFHAIAQGHVHLRRARILRDILRLANASSRRIIAPTDSAAVVQQVDRTPEGVPIALDDAPQLPSLSPQPSPNQESGPNPLPDKILQESHELTHAN